VNFRPSLSVEVEPPRIHTKELEQLEIYKLLEAINLMAPLVDLISVTNRPTFRLSSISTMKLIKKKLHRSKAEERIFPVQHLTTRLSTYDTYNELLDAKRLGIEYLLPVLGDPRGPKISGFFRDSMDLLAFIKGVTDPQYNETYANLAPSIKETNASFIDDTKFSVGSVFDPNEVRRSHNGNWNRIRENQIDLFNKRMELESDFFISQAVFDPFQALEFIDEIDSKNIPIGIGIIPPTFTIAKTIGVRLPPEVIVRLKKLQSKKQQYELAIQIARENYNILKENGVQWIHIYCLGNPEILQSVSQVEHSCMETAVETMHSHP
jgi:5,10-methylenetetrahydrofolate reductase